MKILKKEDHGPYYDIFISEVLIEGLGIAHVNWFRGDVYFNFFDKLRKREKFTLDEYTQADGMNFEEFCRDKFGVRGEH